MQSTDLSLTSSVPQIKQDRFFWNERVISVNIRTAHIRHVLKITSSELHIFILSLLSEKNIMY